MSAVRVAPSVAHGRLRAPGSKSYTHRFLLAAHLAASSSRVRRPLVSDDTLRTAAGLRQLGSRVRLGPGEWAVEPARTPPRGSRTLDCGESGTTLRLLSAAAALEGRAVRFVGSGRLPGRPMAPLFDALERLGASLERPRGRAALPFRLRGPIHGGMIELDVGQSSQFTSALLFALPTVLPDSEIRTRGDAVSAPYVLASLEVLRRRSVTVEPVPGGYRIPGGQRFSAAREPVPGDASSAAYLWAAAAVTGGSVTVDGVPADWPQADLAVLELLRAYGAEVVRHGASVRVRGDRRRGFRCELTDAPDLYPLAGVLAATTPARSVLRGAPHVQHKESNRKRETARLARAMGARVDVARGGLAIEGTARPRAIRLLDLTDHRLVMSAAVGALAAGAPSEIGEAAAVGKSFPGYFDALEKLGVEVRRR